VAKADGFTFQILAESRAGSTAFFVTAVPVMDGRPVKPKDRLASAGRVGWASTGCISPSEPKVFKGWGGAAIDESAYLGPVLNWISKKATECTAIGKPNKSVRFTSCALGKAWRIDFPSQAIVEVAPGPCEFPRATPPPPSSGVKWNESEAPGSAREVCGKATPKHLAAVLATLKGEPPTTTESEATFYARICPRVRAALPGCDCAMYAEELAVACDSSRSENYDVLAWGSEIQANRLRTGEGTYQTTCAPASRSADIGDVAAPPPSGSYPRPVFQVRAKVHVPAAQRPDGRAVLDAVALSCGENPDFPGRQCWPSCGPEGSAGREECDRALAVKWEGGDEHPSNPWLRLVRPGQRARVCVGVPCSDWVPGR
jgi:hypothetical protein